MGKEGQDHKSIEDIAKEISEVIESEIEELPIEWSKVDLDAVEDIEEFANSVVEDTLNALEKGDPDKLRKSGMFYITMVMATERGAKEIGDDRVKRIINRYEEITGNNYEEMKTKTEEVLAHVG